MCQGAGEERLVCLYLNTVIQKRLLIALHMAREQLSGS